MSAGTAARPGSARRGYSEAVLAAALWGSSGVFSVHLFRMGVPPETVGLWRALLGLLMLIGYYGIVRRSTLRVPWIGLAVLAIGGGIVVAVFQIAYQASIDAVGVPGTVALLYLAPAFVVAASGPVLGEWPSRRRVALAAVAVGGVWLSVWGAHGVQPMFGTSGLGWGLASGVCYAVYTLLGRYAVPRWGSAPTLVYSTAGACVLLAVALPALTDAPMLPQGAGPWMALALFALLTMAIAEPLFFDALRHVQASRASIAATAEPLVAALLATALLAQGLRPVGWVGLLLVVVGVAGVGFSAREDEG